MKKSEKSETVEGGSPSRHANSGKSKHTDDSTKPSSQIKKETIRKSEKGNMNDKKGYNETPANVPVKSSSSK